jgi:DNA-binding NarL/FixJ family response regulator
VTAGFDDVPIMLGLLQARALGGLLVGDLDAVRCASSEGTRLSREVGDLYTPALLGKREEEVARLVAEGLSNKQIGARLFISERTVESHVRGILNKLGFNSRAQIAGWMASPNQ